MVTQQSCGGGILVYIRETLVIYPNDNPDLNFSQYSNFTIRLAENSMPLNIFAIYRSPNSDEKNNEELCRIFDNIKQNTVLFGDFNYPKVNWLNQSCDNPSRPFMDKTGEKLFEQMVDFPTHRAGNILDLVLTNNPGIILNVEDAGVLGTSDHNMIVVEINCNPMKRTSTQQVPNWSKADQGKMSDTLKSFNWTEDMSNLGTEEAWTLFKARLQKTVDDCVPTIVRRSSNKPIWLDQKTKATVRKKYKLYKKLKDNHSNEAEENYKRQEKLAAKAVKQAKRKFERKLSKSQKGPKDKQFTSYIRSKTKGRTSVGPLIDHHLQW